MFIVLKVILFVVNLKHCSFWTSADVISVSNDLVHDMTGQCMFAHHMCKLWPLWGDAISVEQCILKSVNNEALSPTRWQSVQSISCCIS
jgi:hypothetical protein